MFPYPGVVTYSNWVQPYPYPPTQKRFNSTKKLERIQKRTNKYKSDEVSKHRHVKSPETSKQEIIRLEVNPPPLQLNGSDVQDHVKIYPVPMKPCSFSNKSVLCQTPASDFFKKNFKP